MRKPWEKSNKPYVLTMEYAKAAGVILFGCNGPTRNFYRIYNFFKRLDETILDLFHEFIQAHGADPNLSMRALFYEAPKWNQQQRTAQIKETHIEDYLKLLEEW